MKLASNETPWAPHPQVLEAVAGAAAHAQPLSRSGQVGAAPARSPSARDLSPARVAVGNGSCEILLAAAEALLEPGAELVYAWPSFSMYPHLAAAVGRAADHGAARRRRATTTSTRWRARSPPRRACVLVCNPNNPTATALPPATIDAFVAELPRHVAVILDEAYVEFSTLQDPDDSLDLLKRHPNLVLLRTFSKVYGLCGLRAGYALGSEEFRLAVDRVRQPFSVNALAQAAAAEAIAPPGRGRAARGAHGRSSGVHVESELERARPGDHRQPGQLLLGLARATATRPTIVAGLAERGVIVRAGAALGEEGRLRVTYGTRPENDRFLAALDEAARELCYNQRRCLATLSRPLRSAPPRAPVGVRLWYWRFS